MVLLADSICKQRSQQDIWLVFLQQITVRGEIKLIVAIRGATTVNDNTLEEISSKTVELLTEVMVRNQLSERDLISIIFTMTDDLNAYYPAAAVREAGLIKNTPLMCVKKVKYWVVYLYVSDY